VISYSEGVDDIFADDNFGEAAFWKVDAVGAGVAVRVIHSSPDNLISYGGNRALITGDVIEVRASEVAAPKRGDIVEITGKATYDIMGAPALDPLGLVWTCEAKVRPNP
jgi:hypothetical protein